MTGEKMATILTVLEQAGIPIRGVWIGSTVGGGIGLNPSGQLPRHIHAWLLSRGFIFSEDQYIYRPRK